MLENTVHWGQSRLILDTTKRRHAIVAGVGYGKSFCGPPWHLKRCTDNPRSPESLVLAPDNKLLKNRCLAEYEAFLQRIGLVEGTRGDYKINHSTGDLQITFRWGPKRWGQKVYFLTAEAPQKIVSYNISHAWLDEPGLMNEQVYKNVVKRLRCPYALYRQIFETGTPEGLNHFYERYHPDKVPRIDGTPYSESERALVLHGRSHDNPYLDQAYLDDLESEFGWDNQYYANYILGEWTSLSRDRFYFCFDEREHVGDYQPDPELGRLYLCWDNNVGVMTWAIIQHHVEFDEYWVVADNGGRGRNIDNCIEQFVDAFPPKVWAESQVVVLGDAALHQRSNQTYTTGYQLILQQLRKHYPNVTERAHRNNPFVEERSRCTNKLFHDNRLRIDRNCRKVIQSAKTAECDPKRGIKKPSGDTVTHAMEAIDMALIVLVPPAVSRGYEGLKAA